MFILKKNSVRQENSTIRLYAKKYVENIYMHYIGHI